MEIQLMNARQHGHAKKADDLEMAILELHNRNDQDMEILTAVSAPAGYGHGV
jgi:hypothetical protein